MASATTDGFDRRAVTFERLAVRNRVVAVLRIIVPAVGILALMLLVAQIWIQSIARQYGISGIRIDRGALVVETPQYSGVGADGSTYRLTAREARSPIGEAEVIAMTDPVFDLTRVGASPVRATAAQGTLFTAAEQVDVPGLMTLRAEDGMHGTVTAVHADQKTGIMTGAGPVDLTLSDGSHLLAANMHYDGQASIWSFEQADLTIPDLPAAEPATADLPDVSAAMEPKP